VFNDDQHIMYFISNTHVIKEATIDDDEHKRSLQAEASDSKGHLITKDMAMLEKLYDLQENFEGPRNSKTHSSTMRHKLINLRREKDLNFVNLCTCT